MPLGRETMSIAGKPTEITIETALDLLDRLLATGQAFHYSVKVAPWSGEYVELVGKYALSESPAADLAWDALRGCLRCDELARFLTNVIVSGNRHSRRAANILLADDYHLRQDGIDVDSFYFKAIVQYVEFGESHQKTAAAKLFSNALGNEATKTAKLFSLLKNADLAKLRLLGSNLLSAQSFPEGANLMLMENLHVILNDPKQEDEETAIGHLGALARVGSYETHMDWFRSQFASVTSKRIRCALAELICCAEENNDVFRWLLDTRGEKGCMSMSLIAIGNAARRHSVFRQVALDTLSEVLGMTNDRWTRAVCLIALKNMGNAAQILTKDVAKILTSREVFNFRQAAAAALAFITTQQDRHTVSLLKKATTDTNTIVAIAAAKALSVLTGTQPPNVQAKDSREITNLFAPMTPCGFAAYSELSGNSPDTFELRRSIRDGAKNKLTGLEEVMDRVLDDDPYVKSVAIVELGSSKVLDLGGKYRGQLKVLCELAQKQDYAHRAAAVAALKHFGQSAAHMYPYFCARLKDTNDSESRYLFEEEEKAIGETLPFLCDDKSLNLEISDYLSSILEKYAAGTPQNISHRLPPALKQNAARIVPLILGLVANTDKPWAVRVVAAQTLFRLPSVVTPEKRKNLVAVLSEDPENDYQTLMQHWGDCMVQEESVCLRELILEVIAADYRDDDQVTSMLRCLENNKQPDAEFSGIRPSRPIQSRAKDILLRRSLRQQAAAEASEISKIIRSAAVAD